ncbi:unnamed protein product [Rotaria magnacalcarata]|uniref:Serine aminopeptidase S33 domain-containing protein n=1 Tax=Rotaria magnacalcarata TaxID=392030 RepID=A0A816Q801_9BILA|nr:unnamed protein product [Rotaria magnacalcarata]CAF2121381.1 unnamed protein product [Rotaria magnacalcarata]CAF4033624.1 unnamed protein product [Rotaria magnacalcarata]
MSNATATKPTIEYETTTFTLKPDNIGPNKATLLHARSKKNDSQFYKAILYIHGYSDYYFHDHMCIEFLEHGYDFFALDLRKCGRSIISPAQDQYRHYFNDIHEYDEEITLSIDQIVIEANHRVKKLIVYGHSTGGLIACLYGSSGLRHKEIDAIILTSPYLAALETSFTESMLLSVARTLHLTKDIDDNWYNRTIHVSSRGEWDFDISKKPIDKIRAHGVSFAAIHRAQQELMSKGSCIKCPILSMCSHRSLKPDANWRDEYTQADLLLNVPTMRQAVSTVGSQITICEIENGIHDIFLSSAPVREKAFKLMFRWLKHLEEDWME